MQLLLVGFGNLCSCCLSYWQFNLWSSTLHYIKFLHSGHRPIHSCCPAGVVPGTSSKSCWCSWPSCKLCCPAPWTVLLCAYGPAGLLSCTQAGNHELRSCWYVSQPCCSESRQSCIWSCRFAVLHRQSCIYGPAVLHPGRQALLQSCWSAF